MPEKSYQPVRLPKTIEWVLRATVALQCLGNWRWLTQIGESPLLSWLLSQPDVGGLGWSEATALATQNTIGWLALAAGVCVLWRPYFVATVPLVLFQLCLAIAMWQTGYGFKPHAPWLPPEMGAVFPFLTQAARIAAPAGLLLLVSCGNQCRFNKQRLSVTASLMRWAIAATFLGHGIEAWFHHPEFLDLLIGTSGRLFGTSLPQSAAEQLLSTIAVLDLLVAVACVTTRIQGVLWWMALWGGITAVSRMTTFGFETVWHQTLIRTPHVGVPLAVVLIGHLLTYHWAALDKEEPLAPDVEKNL